MGLMWERIIFELIKVVVLRGRVERVVLWNLDELVEVLVMWKMGEE